MKKKIVSMMVLASVAFFMGCNDQGVANEETTDEGVSSDSRGDSVSVPDSTMPTGKIYKGGCTDDGKVPQGYVEPDWWDLECVKPDTDTVIVPVVKPVATDSVYQGGCTDNGLVPKGYIAPDWWYLECVQRETDTVIVPVVKPVKPDTVYQGGCTNNGLVPQGYAEPEWWFLECVRPKADSYLTTECAQEARTPTVSTLLDRYANQFQPWIAKYCSSNPPNQILK